MAHSAEPPLGPLAALLRAMGPATGLIRFKRDFELLFHIANTLYAMVRHRVSDHKNKILHNSFNLRHGDTLFEGTS